jgi:two-component system, NarL family, invasion response regulator UvrY
MTTSTPKLIAIVDDHILVREGLTTFLHAFDEFKVILHANNGQDFISKVKEKNLPDIVLLDIRMPVMDGYETLNWLHQHHPLIKTLMLTQLDDELSAIRSLQLGAMGYLPKTAEPGDFKRALDNVSAGKRYFTNVVIGQELKINLLNCLNKRELEFIQLACATSMDYGQIASLMNVSRHTIDGYRKHLFEKFEVHSREGLMLFAWKNKLVDP